MTRNTISTLHFLANSMENGKNNRPSETHYWRSKTTRGSYLDPYLSIFIKIFDFYLVTQYHLRKAGNIIADFLAIKKLLKSYRLLCILNKHVVLRQRLTTRKFRCTFSCIFSKLATHFHLWKVEATFAKCSQSYGQVVTLVVTWRGWNESPRLLQTTKSWITRI